MKVCRLCFQDIKGFDFPYIIKDFVVCPRCYEDIKPTFTKFKVDDVEALSIYDYTPKIQSLLYQFKGCFDIELGEMFLERFRFELSLIFKGYIMVPIPSFKEDDEIREFNHVEEMFKFLKLKTIKLLTKTKSFKQALKNYEDRKQIEKYISLIERPDLHNKKILLVDDVFTTGSTMRSAIRLIKELHPRCIKVLVMSKTIFKEKDNSNNLLFDQTGY